MQNRWIQALACVAAMAWIAPAAAAQDAEMEAALAQLEAALPGKLINNPFTTKWDAEGPRVRSKVVASDTAPGGAAFEVSNRERLQNAYDARVVVPIDVDIAKGDEIEVAVWVRAQTPSKALGSGKADLQVVRNREPYDNIFSVEIRPGEDWELFSARGVAASNFKAGQAEFGANIGYGRQVLQFGPIYIVRVSTEAEREAG